MNANLAQELPTRKQNDGSTKKFTSFNIVVLKLREMITTHQIANIIIVAIAGSGFILARYIFTKKRRKEKIVCLLDSNCDIVVHSQYSTFLGVPLEVFGMIYFALIGLFFIGTFFVAELNSIYFATLMPIITFGAFAFSIYLSTVQLSIIKQWCSWCLISTILCATEFAIIFTTSTLNFKALLFAVLNI